MTKPYERLSAQDTAFLYAESPVSHMHVGSLTIFENAGVTEESLNALITRRLHFVPRFRKKLSWVPGSVGRPVWVDDPHFDLRFHVRYTGLPRPGSEHEALQLMGRVMSRPLDRQRPLWEVWVFELPDSRIALIHKTHHCLIDGISSVDLGTVMLDLTRDPPPIDSVPPWQPRQAPTRERLLFDSLVERTTQPAEILRTLRAATRPPREVVRHSLDVGKGLFSLSRASLHRTPQTSLARPIGPHRRFEIVRISLADAKALKNRFDCTVNDVILGLVTGGLRRLFASRGESVAGLELGAAVPVSVADTSDRMAYGNTVAMVTADLPVGEPSPSRRLELIRTRMADVMESKQAVGADFWVRLSEYAPPTILSLASRAVMLGPRGVQVTVMNVPGPQTPMYLHGGQMLDAFPCIPIIGTTSLGIAVLSYNGQLDFGLCGDWDVVPDLDVLAAGIREALAELQREAATVEVSHQAAGAGA